MQVITMKRWELLLAGLILCSFPVSAYNVFAPNSFEDVQPDSYAYQTLRDMCGQGKIPGYSTCLLYTSDAADEARSVDIGGRRIIK